MRSRPALTLGVCAATRSLAPAACSGAHETADVGCAATPSSRTTGCPGPAAQQAPPAELEELYVRPRLRGQGISTGLITAAVERVGESGAVEMRIDAEEADVDARRFYERHGFSDRDPDSGSRMLCHLQEVDDPGSVKGLTLPVQPHDRTSTDVQPRPFNRPRRLPRPGPSRRRRPPSPGSNPCGPGRPVPAVCAPGRRAHAWTQAACGRARARRTTRRGR